MAHRRRYSRRKRGQKDNRSITGGRATHDGERNVQPQDEIEAEFMRTRTPAVAAKLEALDDDEHCRVLKLYVACALKRKSATQRRKERDRERAAARARRDALAAQCNPCIIPREIRTHEVDEAHVKRFTRRKRKLENVT